MSTISDVAQAAGVSTSTVSRYLNGTLNVTQSTAARITAAAEALNYRANRSARALASGHSDMLGLVVPSLTNPFFAALAEHVAADAAQRGLTVLLGSTGGETAREGGYSHTLAGIVDGLIYVGMHSTNDRLADLVRSGLPIVIADEVQKDVANVDTVTVDNFAGAFQATSYLLTLGHRRIAYVGGAPDLESTRTRQQGYEAALRRGGLEPTPSLLWAGNYTEEYGASILTHLLSQPESPTAVFAGSDSIAIGMLNAAETYGIDIPGDLSLVGFDDIPLNSLLRPRLTSVAQPVTQIATACVDLLVTRIAEPDRSPRTRVLPVTLAIRDSARSPLLTAAP